MGKKTNHNPAHVHVCIIIIKCIHLLDLYNSDGGKASGLALVPKLKFEHIHLTSFSKMRVDLATQVCSFMHALAKIIMINLSQVLSESVSKALTLTIGSRAIETAKFVSIMDKFFDALNVSNFTNGKKKQETFSKSISL